MPALYWLRAFGKAVLLGSLAGGAPMMLITMPAAMISFGEEGYGLSAIGRALFLGFSPVFLSAMFVIPTAILIGLPAWLVFKWRHWDTPALLAAIGAVAGVVVVWVIVFPLAGPMALNAAFLAAFSGGVTGYVWGRDATHE